MSGSNGILLGSGDQCWCTVISGLAAQMFIQLRAEAVVKHRNTYLSSQKYTFPL